MCLYYGMMTTVQSAPAQPTSTSPLGDDSSRVTAAHEAVSTKAHTVGEVLAQAAAGGKDVELISLN